MKIHDQLRASRTAAHLTQGEVAAAVGLERETYTRIERGKQGTTVDTMTAIGEVLGLRLTFEPKKQHNGKKSGGEKC